ncbi:NAD(P)-dependent oxidoreductase [Microbacterium sp. YMB-B2]|uniref:NAD(P)-dependent oxidoreductase n=1 Tax=Microbacterium tenebrionis TaxID=2830665 RepID=A0A9X1LQH4_9MICO|nr:NAD(P)-dependent oxidoreductase [Microbacterium tenebrionis]MCC2030054.1 NAD(P)-dependent oxidoreductase [Microbacterium tenebrionis]
MTGDTTTVAFIGLGNMGIPMALQLIAAGHRVAGYDVSADARAALVTQGGIASDNLTEVVAGADIVILMLPNSDIVTQVTSDPEFQAGLHADLFVIDMGSSEPMVTRALAEHLAGIGITLIDAPVSGGVRGAASGTLTIMVGGSGPAVDRVQNVLTPLGRIVRTGPVGSGHVVKALNNLLSATHLWATSEAMLVGERFGVDPKVMLDVLNGSSGRSGSTENKWPNFILSETYDSGFGLRLMLKDMRIANALAVELGVPNELGDFAAERWADAAEDLPSTADHTEIAHWIASRAH